MIKHIVLFKLKENMPEKDKKEVLDTIEKGLKALPKLVAPLKHLEVGINCNQRERYDLALLTEFESMNDLEAYASHPEHLKVGQIIRQVLEERACVDYEF